MQKWLLLITLMIMTTNTMANKNVGDALGKYAWDKRQIIVFTPDNKNKEYKLFINRLIEFKEEIKERNLQTWHVIADSKILLNSVVRTDVNNKDFRDVYKVKKNEFRILLLGYDQGEKLRLENTNLNRIFSVIDQMPMRIQEMQAQ